VRKKQIVPTFRDRVSVEKMMESRDTKQILLGGAERQRCGVRGTGKLPQHTS